jgi:ABC-type cobalamin/Fe3+-siderophores transport system ATPase subunit
MKLDEIHIRNQPPVHTFDATQLSSVVVIAGPNGVGKTRLMNSLLSLFRSQAHAPGSGFVVSATCDEERNAWGRERLDSSDPAQRQLLNRLLQRRQQRGHWRSGALHFDSKRQFSQIQPLQWQWNFQDPAAEEINWDFLFNPFEARFQDTVHAIYRMLGHHRSEIAKRAIEMQQQGQATMELNFPDPLAKFRDAFQLLLGPKVLADIDITNPQIRYVEDGTVLGIDNLSSGEREAFNIIFDLLLRNPQDCIVFFDEPELHLHPELSFRLLKTLEVVGPRNQFIFFTHSADIISGAMDQSVVFLTRRPAGENQAIDLRSTDDTVTALRELGQGLGIISLGRKIVLIEGTESSVDRDTYGAIVHGKLPNLTLSPSGSRQTILSFARVVEDVLQQTIWGIDFYMLADRDNSLPDQVLQELENRANGRLRFLPRLHVENYFLDEETLAEAFRHLVPEDDWRRRPAEIRERLVDLARAMIPQSVNLWLSTRLRSLVGDLDVSVRGPVAPSVDELKTKLLPVLGREGNRIAEHLDPAAVASEVESRWQELESSLANGTWKLLFPGKIILGQFASQAGLKVGMLRSGYIAAARTRDFAPFADIVDIMTSWSDE